MRLDSILLGAAAVFCAWRVWVLVSLWRSRETPARESGRDVHDQAVLDPPIIPSAGTEVEVRRTALIVPPGVDVGASEVGGRAVVIYHFGESKAVVEWDAPQCIHDQALQHLREMQCGRVVE